MPLDITFYLFLKDAPWLRFIHLCLQEFMILPIGAPSFKEAMKMGVEVYHHLKVFVIIYLFIYFGTLPRGLQLRHHLLTLYNTAV